MCDPTWISPAETSYSRAFGGRWNPPGAFGILYLNASLEAAAANARAALRREFGNAVAFSDLRKDRRPDVARFRLTRGTFVDAVTPEGILALGLPATYPEKCEHGQCQAIGQFLYDSEEAGIAARSAAAPTEEELALFDSHVRLARQIDRLDFDAWYPGLVPP